METIRHFNRSILTIKQIVCIISVISLIAVSGLILATDAYPSSVNNVKPNKVEIKQPVKPKKIKKKIVKNPPLNPFLQIKKVYVSPKDNKLRIVIHNTGGGSLTSKEYRTGKLEVTLPGTTTKWIWSLIKVNKKKNHFIAETTFNTNKVFTEKTRIKVRIKGVKAGKPWIGSLPLKSKVNKKIIAIKRITPIVPKVKIIQPDQKPVSLKKSNKPNPAVPLKKDFNDVVYKSGGIKSDYGRLHASRNDGIDIIEPAMGSIHNPGSIISIQFRYSGDVLGVTGLYFSNVDHGGMLDYSANPGVSRGTNGIYTISYQIPEDIREGFGYTIGLVGGNTAENIISGYSGSFSISQIDEERGAEALSVEVLAPQNQSLVLGVPVEISFRVTGFGRSTPMPRWNIQLITEERRNNPVTFHTEWQRINTEDLPLPVYFDLDQGICKARWSSPPSLTPPAPTRYRIQVISEHIPSSGTMTGRYSDLGEPFYITHSSNLAIELVDIQLNQSRFMTIDLKADNCNYRGTLQFRIENSYWSEPWVIDKEVDLKKRVVESVNIGIPPNLDEAAQSEGKLSFKVEAHVQVAPPNNWRLEDTKHVLICQLIPKASVDSILIEGRRLSAYSTTIVEPVSSHQVRIGGFYHSVWDWDLNMFIHFRNSSQFPMDINVYVHQQGGRYRISGGAVYRTADKEWSYTPVNGSIPWDKAESCENGILSVKLDGVVPTIDDSSITVEVEFFKRDTLESIVITKTFPVLFQAPE